MTKKCTGAPCGSRVFSYLVWQIIRSTWGRPRMPKVKTRLAFLLGSTENAKLQEEIERENSAYHDIVQGDFVDTYHNLSYKSIMGKFWVSEFCEQVGLRSESQGDLID